MSNATQVCTDSCFWVDSEVTNSENDRGAAKGRVRGRDAEEEKEKEKGETGSERVHCQRTSVKDQQR